MKREQCGELIVLFWCKGLTLWPLRVTDWVKRILSNFTLYVYQLFDFVLCFFCRSTTVLTSTLVYQTTNSLQQKGYVLYNSDFTSWSLQTLVRPQHPYCVKSHNYTNVSTANRYWDRKWLSKLDDILFWPELSKNAHCHFPIRVRLIFS